MSKNVSARGVARAQRAEEKRVLAAAQKRTKGKFSSGDKTADSFQNFALNLGIGTNNATSQSTYGFNPITRVRTELEWIHRGSWLGGVAIDIVADDMTREGIEIKSEIDPEDKELLDETAEETDVWGQLNAAIKWARLYGGAIVVPLIDGQNLETPLIINRIAKGAFKGLLVLDRWSVEPSLENLVTEPGPFLGKPKYYTVTSDAPGYRQAKIHYTRAFRLLGIELPYWQAVMENLWGISVFERLYDRMIAFDSASTGAAQLVYRAWNRVMKMKKLREAVATGGDMFRGVVANVEFMRQFQGIEGVTLIDSEDDLDVISSSTSFAGLSDALMQFAQQLAGALQIPLVRLFGQSPAGLNSTGESDLRTYYEGIKKQQKKMLKRPVLTIYKIMAQSLGIDITGGLRIDFKSLWQLDDKGKAEVAKSNTETVLGAFEAAVIDRATALKELRAKANETGTFSTITDEMIKEAESDPPPWEMKQDQHDLAMNPPQTDGQGQSKPGAPVPGLGSGKTADGSRARLVDANGIPLFIETFLGESRHGVGKDGKEWRAILQADYGYVEGTASAEGPFEQMDVFVGPNPMIDTAYVIDQIDPDTKAFDEHKVMMGFANLNAAMRAYSGSYSDKRDRVMAITPISMDGLKDWLKTGDVRVPLSSATGFRLKVA